MLILPVLDVMRGQVVRAVGGRRSDYKPLASQLTDSTDPIEVMAAIRERFGWTQFYVADLDAITGGGRPALELFHHHPTAYQLWVDAGVHTVDEAVEVRRAHVAQVVIGSETLADLN